jgi:hypothetical protein
MAAHHRLANNHMTDVAPRPITDRSLATEDTQTFVLGEVFEVFDVQGGQREVIGQATRGYPRVIRRPGRPRR